jgi:hypothetical protein
MAKATRRKKIDDGQARYTKAEIRERVKEVKKLRDDAVRSWSRDDGMKGVAIVMMTFAEYLNLKAEALGGVRS